MKKPVIILASKSPRRLELLKKAIKGFKVFPSSFNEQNLREKAAVKFAVKAAVGKAKDIGKRYPSSIVIGADTIVVLNGKIFGKPKNPEDSKRMLKALSGKIHQVITGIAVYKKNEDKLVSAYESTDVAFKKITQKEIEDYINEGNVHDKAGSYAIQDIGEKFIKGIKGDHDNVVGLPIALLKGMLRLFQ
ncbi:MAG: Maf family protein [bacterium]